MASKETMKSAQPVYHALIQITTGFRETPPIFTEKETAPGGRNRELSNGGRANG